MALFPPHLLAHAVPDAVPLRAGNAPIRVVIASLARGGAERIVLEWLAAEAGRGRAVELAVLYRRRQEYAVPPGIALVRRDNVEVGAFVDALAARWQQAASPVSAHLVTDELLRRFWAAGVRTVPVLHNTSEGWRNDPASWEAPGVPLAIACAGLVREQALSAGCRVPVVPVRHRPRVGAQATDAGERARIRQDWGLAPGTFVVGVVGAFKAQKDHARAVEVLAELRRSREAVLVILGGTLDASGLAELGQVASRAASLRVQASLRLPGFVEPIEPWYAAFDALLNVSRHEGLSIATQEALAAGLPVVASDVGGQAEIGHPGLRLLPAGAPAREFARRLGELPLRERPVADPRPRFPREWTLATSWRAPSGRPLDTLFVTANLNAGGAQRSLVNLARTLARRHRLAIAVCGDTTHPAFPGELAGAGIDCFRPAGTAEPFAVAEGVLAAATAAGASCLCFWNADARVKLLVAKFAPPGLALVDASPGAYAHAELHAAGELAEAIGFGPPQYLARLDVLVSKYADPQAPRARRNAVIANGVAPRPLAPLPTAAPRFLVCGRIAPSKRLDTVLEAVRLARPRLPGLCLALVGQAEARHEEYLVRLLAQAEGLPVDFRGASPALGHLAEPFTAAIVLGTHQGCPNAVLEAMSAGLAVIANDSGGTRELVRGGETGWLLAEDCDAALLAQAMVEAASDPAAARARGLAGREHMTRHHALEAMALRYLSILDPQGRRLAPPEETILGKPQLLPA